MTTAPMHLRLQRPFFCTAPGFFLSHLARLLHGQPSNRRALKDSEGSGDREFISGQSRAAPRCQSIERKFKAIDPEPTGARRKKWKSSRLRLCRLKCAAQVASPLRRTKRRDKHQQGARTQIGRRSASVTADRPGPRVPPGHPWTWQQQKTKHKNPSPSR